MNFMLRIALQLLAAFVFLLICIQVIILGVAWLLWPDLIRTGNTSNHYEIFVVALCSVLFVVTLLWIGWYLGKPLYIMIVWIRSLVSGRFDPPPGWNNLRSHKKGRLKFPYAIYKEVFEHLRMLGSTLQNNEKALREAEQSKQEWIRGISHDLKTPLTYISGYSAMLVHPDYRWSETEKSDFLSVIQQKAAHLQELVEDLNETVNGPIPLNAENTDIVELVRRTVADVSSAPWAAGYAFVMDSEPEQLSISCDPKLMTRAIRNLLVNAVIHNPEDTRIEARIKLLDHRIAEIRIKDNGVGFNQHAARVTIQPTSEHAGLGLSIAKKFIEAHGGTIMVQSSLGEGTSILIRLKAEHI